MEILNFEKQLKLQAMHSAESTAALEGAARELVKVAGDICAQINCAAFENLSDAKKARAALNKGAAAVKDKIKVLEKEIKEPYNDIFEKCKTARALFELKSKEIAAVVKELNEMQIENRLAWLERLWHEHEGSAYISIISIAPKEWLLQSKKVNEIKKEMAVISEKIVNDFYISEKTMPNELQIKARREFLYKRYKDMNAADYFSKYEGGYYGDVEKNINSNELVYILAKKISLKNGIEMQVNKAIEELGELIEGLKKNNRANIIEEIFDVQFMILQIMQLYEISPFDIWDTFALKYKKLKDLSE